MGWLPWLLAALVVAPLWATGELGLYSFDEPRSHLVWDEAMGGDPRPYDGPGGAMMLGAQVVAGLVLLGAVLVVAWPRSR